MNHRHLREAVWEANASLPQAGLVKWAQGNASGRDPDTGVLDRGLLSVPVVREIGLADGSVVQARMVDLIWVLEVTEVGDASNGLTVGDVLASETASGVDFTTPDALLTHAGLAVTVQIGADRLAVNADMAGDRGDRPPLLLQCVDLHVLLVQI